MASRKRRKPDDSGPRGWLLLMHQLPSRPAYLRVKVWRGLRDAGAIVIRNSGYVLPRNDHTAAVLREIIREIERGKGQAALCEAAFVDGIGDDELRSLFNKARDGDYAALEAELRTVSGAKAKRDRPGDSRARLEKISQRLQHIIAIDFFGAKGRVKAESLLARLEHRFIVRDEPIVRAAQGAAAVRAGCGSRGRASMSTASPAPG